MFKRKQTENNSRRRSSQPEQKRTFISYYATNQTAESSPKKVDRQRLQEARNVKPRHLPFVFGILTLVFCLLYTTLLNSNAKILTVNRSVNLLREQSVYQNAANEI